MASGDRSLRGSVSLDELIALNDEILALVRAGVPLELGLRQNAGGLSRRLTRLTTSVADQLSSGVDLAAAVQKADAGMPPIYQAILAAGLKSGRLDKALEGVTRAARHVAALRHLLLVAMVYPLIVFLLAYGLFIAVLLYVAPTLLMFAEGKPGALLSILDSIRDSVSIWGPIVPLVVLAAWLAWLFQSSRALSIQRQGGIWNLRLPLIHAMVRDAHYAMFAELLALLVEHEVPLDQSLLTAAMATADKKLARAAEETSQQVARGEKSGLITVAGLPTLVRWALSMGTRGDLCRSLQSAAASYQQRVLRRADLLRIYLPAVLTIAIGGTATLVYALSVFTPFTQMLRQIALPGGGI